MAHVLIVDNDPTVREAFRSFLEAEAYQVSMAADFFEAEPYLTRSLLADPGEADCVDIVVADVDLPRVSGLDLLQRVRQIDENIMVVVVTSEPDVSTAAEALRLGAYDYVVKPISQRVLSRVVGRATEKKVLLDDKRRLKAENLAYQAELEKRVAERTVELEQRNRELAALIEFGRDMSSTLDLNDVLSRVTQRAAQICGAHRCTILMLAEDDRTLVPLMSQFSDGQYDEDLWRRFRDASYPVPVDQIVESQTVIGERRSVFIEDVGMSSLPSKWIEPFGVKSVLLVPLVSKERVVGAMALDQVEEHRRFTEAQVDLATAIASQAAVAIENARLYEETRRLFKSEQKRASQLAVVNRVARQIASILDLDQLFQEIVRAILVGFGYLNVLLGLVDEERGDLTIPAIAGVFEGEGPSDYRQTLDVGILGWTARTGQSVLANDVSQDPHYVPGFLEDDLTKSELCVPLKLGDRIIGVLDVQDTQLNAFDKTDLTTLETMADQIVLAIENVRLYGEVKRWAEEMTMLYHTSLEISGPMELSDLLWKICDRAAKLIHADKGGFYLYDEARDELELVVPYKLGRDFIGTRLRPGEGVAGRVVQMGAPLSVEEYSTWEDRAKVYNGEPFTSVIGVPLKWQDRIIGAITLAGETARRTFAPADKRLLDLFAQQAALAVQNSRLYDEAKRHVEELTILHQIDVAITSSLNLEDVLTVVYERVDEVMSPSAFYIGLYDEASDEMHVPIWTDNKERQPSLTFKIGNGRGLSEWVLRTGQPLVVGNMERERESLPVEAIDIGTPTCAMMVFPLTVKDRVIGVISAQSETAYAFDAGHRRLFEGIARQVAIAVENAQLFEAAKSRADKLSSLHNAAVAISSSLDLDSVLCTLAEQVGTTLGVSSVYICDWDDQAETTTILAKWVSLDAAEVETVSDLGSTYEMNEYPVTLRALREKRPLILRATDPDLTASDRAGVEQYKWQAVMVVPMVSRDRVIGYAELWETRREREFTADEVQLCQTLAADAAVAIQNARLFEQMARRLAESQVLQEIMQAAASTLNFDHVLERAIEVLHRMLGIDYLVFALPNESEQGTALMLHPSQVGYSETAGISLPLDNSVSGRVYRRGEPEIIPDVREVDYYFGGRPDIRSELAVPVNVAGRVVAVLNAESVQPSAFDEDDLRLFTSIASQLGVMLENARLYQETSRHAQNLRLLADASAGMLGGLEPQKIVDHLVSALVARFESPCGVSLVDQEGAHMTLVGSWMPGEKDFPLPLGFRIRLAGRQGLAQIVEARRLVYIPDVERSEWWRWVSEPEQNELRQARIKAILLVPMVSQERVVGIVSMRFYDPLPEPVLDQLDWVQTLVNQAAAALVGAQLYQELEEKAEELSRAYTDLQEINRLRTELVQNVGHELRTPLGLVKGYVELLLAGDLGGIIESQRDALEIIYARVATLEQLIHNLTMLQVVPPEAMKLVPVSLLDLVRDVLAEFEMMGGKVGICFRDELPSHLPLVRGDEKRLSLAFGHLVDNAVKFSPDGGQVTVTAGSDEGMVHVSISDEGVGIPSEYHERIFERFYQVDGSTTRRFGGMGVGLALVWEIVEAHGGTVNVESQVGGGSTFTVVLPQAAET